jgi:hypothetical protein
MCLYVSPSDRAQLEAWVQDRNALAKWIWRAAIVLATVEALGTNTIMRRTENPSRASGVGRSAISMKAWKVLRATRRGPLAFRRWPTMSGARC